MAKDLKKAEEAIRLFLIAIGENINREGLRNTPKRFVKFMDEFLSPPEYNFTTFQSEKYDEMIIVKDIPFSSYCEHHLAPFNGVAAVAYIPGKSKKILGLSKLPRTVYKFSRRFQNQERITNQIAMDITKVLKPLGVGVVLQGRHSCMEIRGAKAHGSVTVTSSMTGVFRRDAGCKQEFLKFVEPWKAS